MCVCVRACMCACLCVCTCVSACVGMRVGVLQSVWAAKCNLKSRPCSIAPFTLTSLAINLRDDVPECTRASLPQAERA